MQKVRSALVRSLIIGLLPTALWAGPVNINTADAGQLAAELDGIGLERARAIVEYRKAHGAFASPEDLTKVKGVGERILEQNRGNIITGESGKKATGK